MTITQIWNGWLLRLAHWSDCEVEYYATLAEVLERVNTTIEHCAPVLRAIDEASE